MKTWGHVDMRTDWRQRWWRHSFKNHHPVYFCLFHWLGAENKRKQRQKKEEKRWKRTSDKSQIYQPINDPELRSSSHECISGGCVITHQRYRDMEERKQEKKGWWGEDMEMSLDIPAGVRLKWEEGSLFILLLLLPEENPEEITQPTSLSLTHTQLCVCVCVWRFKLASAGS